MPLKTHHFCGILLLCLCISLSAEGVTKARKDSTAVTVRTPAAERLAQFSEDDDFRYDRSVRAGNSVFSQIEFWFWQNVLRFLFAPQYSWIRYAILYGFILISLLYAYYKLRGQQWDRLFRSAADIHLPMTEHPENLREMDFPALISAAETAGQHRLAIRWQFLQVLKHLEEKQLIRWHPHKTNREIISELADQGKASNFSEISDIFEYHWYGHFDISEAEYRQVSVRFEQFLRNTGEGRAVTLQP